MASIPPAHQPGKTVLIIEPTSQIGQPSLQEHRAAQPEAAGAPNTSNSSSSPVPLLGTQPR